MTVVPEYAGNQDFCGGQGILMWQTQFSTRPDYEAFCRQLFHGVRIRPLLGWTCSAILVFFAFSLSTILGTPQYDKAAISETLGYASSR